MSALRRIRIDARLSIDELSVRSGISAEQIRNIETGRAANPRPATLGAIADVLQVAPSAIDPVLNAEKTEAA